MNERGRDMICRCIEAVKDEDEDENENENAAVPINYPNYPNYPDYTFFSD